MHANRETYYLRAGYILKEYLIAFFQKFLYYFLSLQTIFYTLFQCFIIEFFWAFILKIVKWTLKTTSLGLSIAHKFSEASDFIRKVHMLSTKYISICIFNVHMRVSIYDFLKSNVTTVPLCVSNILIQRNYPLRWTENNENFWIFSIFSAIFCYGQRSEQHVLLELQIVHCG